MSFWKRPFLTKSSRPESPTFKDQFEEIRHFFMERVTYKPGYQFSVWRAPDGSSLYVTLSSAPLPDAEGLKPEAQPVHCANMVDFQVLCTEENRQYYAAKLIEDLERHEINEWFKVDGKCVKGPHPEKKYFKDIA